MAVTTNSIGNPGPIVRAGTRSLRDAASTMPNMRGAIVGWFQPLALVTITTSIVDGMAKEVRLSVNSSGVLQPMRAQQVMLKPEGDRAFKWFTLHVGAEIKLKRNDVVIAREVPYRVMGVWDWTACGYMLYELTEDYSAVK